MTSKELRDLFGDLFRSLVTASKAEPFAEGLYLGLLVGVHHDPTGKTAKLAFEAALGDRRGSVAAFDAALTALDALWPPRSKALTLVAEARALDATGAAAPIVELLYQEALTIDPSVGAWWGDLFDCLVASGQRDKAIELWDRLCGQDPSAGTEWDWDNPDRNVTDFLHRVAWALATPSTRWLTIQKGVTKRTHADKFYRGVLATILDTLDGEGESPEFEALADFLKRYGGTAPYPNRPVYLLDPERYNRAAGTEPATPPPSKGDIGTDLS